MRKWRRFFQILDSKARVIEARIVSIVIEDAHGLVPSMAWLREAVSALRQRAYGVADMFLSVNGTFF